MLIVLYWSVCVTSLNRMFGHFVQVHSCLPREQLMSTYEEFHSHLKRPSWFMQLLSAQITLLREGWCSVEMNHSLDVESTCSAMKTDKIGHIASNKTLLWLKQLCKCKIMIHKCEGGNTKCVLYLYALNKCPCFSNSYHR